MDEKVRALREELVGKEISFLNLDNYMMGKGYYSVYDDGATTEIKESKSVVYTSTETQEAEIFVEFEITNNNGSEESEEAFYLKVAEVSLI